MIYTPTKYLFKALAAKVKTLGYVTQGVNTFPRVEIYNFDETPNGHKTNYEWDITCLIEAVSNSTSPAESFDMNEAIKNGVTTALNITNFKCDFMVWEQLTPFQETTETDLIIWRQSQRVRFHLTQNL